VLGSPGLCRARERRPTTARGVQGVGFSQYRTGLPAPNLRGVEAQPPAGYLAECFWPDVQESDLLTLDVRAAESAARLSRQGEHVRYLGSLLMVDDEVVLCHFEGTENSVRRAAQDARIPYERIVKTTHSPRNIDPSS
jgi:hypothetical protein